MSDPMTPDVPDPTVEALSEAERGWLSLGIHYARRCNCDSGAGDRMVADELASTVEAILAARAAAPDALRVAVEALREVSEAASPGRWVAVTGKGPKRRLQQVALLGREDGRGLGAEGCLAVFSGIPATKRADDAEFAAACVNLVRALLDDPALAGRAAGGEG